MHPPEIQPKRIENSRHLALKRFLQPEKRLQLNPELREKHAACMNNYTTLGHNEKVEESSGETAA